MQQGLNWVRHKKGRSARGASKTARKAVPEIQLHPLPADMLASIQHEHVPGILTAALSQAHLNRMSVFIVGLEQRRESAACVYHQQIAGAEELPQRIETGMDGCSLDSVAERAGGPGRGACRGTLPIVR